jgi:paraquat-inducible protein A
MTHVPFPDGLATADLVACPECDALYRAHEVAPGERAACARCGTVLISPRRRAGTAIISLALAAVILVAASLWFPFLRIDLRGLYQEVTLWDVATSFAGGPLLVVSAAVTAAIVIVPLLRAGLILYTLVPVVFDRAPRAHAAHAFALSERLRPWSMAEIFALGCGVSLVKVADLANLSLGPAFWTFGALVAVTIVQDSLVDRWSVWRSIRPA